jgi:phospholipid/cholesterol/gamma-HCH transport system substrate-binding protein
MIPALAPHRHTRLVGVVTLVVMALVLTLSFRLSTLSGLFSGGGRELHAQFTDAAGIAPGDLVRVAGIDVGTVKKVSVQRDHALVDLTVHDGVSLGDRTTATLQLDTLLGQHSLALTPAGSGELASGSTIPLARTTTPFGVTDALLGTAQKLAPIDTRELTKALDTVAATIDPAAPDVRTAATGLSGLARTVSQRENEVQQLFTQTAQISATLATRSKDISTLLANSGSILQTLAERQQVIRSLLRTTSSLAATVTAVIKENQGKVTPALAHLHSVLGVLKDNQADLDESLRLLAPYLRYFLNLTGNGRWFDGTFAGLVPLDVHGLPIPSLPGASQ